jgi:FkbM family methyltransferase
VAILTQYFFDLLSVPFIGTLIKNILGRIVFKHDIYVNISGLKIYTNTIDRLLAALLWKFLSLEAFETEVLHKTIRPGMTVVDIGANIGYYTLLMGKMVGPYGVVHAFEPEPNNFRLLTKNIAVNKIKNIIPVQKAVADRTGWVELYICREHRGDHRIFKCNDDRPSIRIMQTSIDDYFNENSRPDLVKMDVQGSEHLVVAGLKKIAAANQHLVMVVEFSPKLIRECGGNPEIFLEELNLLGFTTYLIDEKHKQLKTIENKELLALCPGARYENIYLIRN